MIKRLLAMLAVSALLVGSIAVYKTRTGMRTDGLYYTASSIHPDAQLIHVNGEAISAEEYLYWLDAVCEYLDSYVGGSLDFDAQLTTDMTFGQYAKTDAANTVVLYAVVRQMADETGVVLAEEDLAALEAQRAQYVSYYGGEEAYQQQLQLLGVSDELLNRINEVPFLYNRIYQAFCTEGTELYPGQEALESYGSENGYMTAQLLYFPTAELDETALADMAQKAQDYASQLHNAQDKQTVYETLAGELGLTTSADGLTFSADEVDEVVYQAVQALAVGEVSGVIEGTGGFYVALRQELNYPSLTEDLFNIRLQDRQDSAKVEYNNSLYERIDAGAFYSSLYDARVALMEDILSQGS